MCEVWHNPRRRLYTNLLTAKAIAYRDWRYATGNDKKKVYIYITCIYTRGYGPDPTHKLTSTVRHFLLLMVPSVAPDPQSLPC